MAASSRSTRSAEDPDVDFPPFDPGSWAGSGHLPITSEVIGAIRSTVSKKVSSNAASEKIGKLLIDHWTRRNVYTKTLSNVIKLLESMYKEFILIRKIFLKGKPSPGSLSRYMKFKEERDRVLDISTEDKERIAKIEEKLK